jgi:hypothetical protein
VGACAPPARGQLCYPWVGRGGILSRGSGGMYPMPRGLDEVEPFPGVGRGRTHTKGVGRGGTRVQGVKRGDSYALGVRRSCRHASNHLGVLMSVTISSFSLDTLILVPDSSPRSCREVGNFCAGSLGWRNFPKCLRVHASKSDGCSPWALSLAACRAPQAGLFRHSYATTHRVSL